MKYLNKILFIIFLGMFTQACQTDLEDLNVDPDRAPTASDQVLLTSALGYLGYIQDQDLNGDVSHLWAQYYTWGIGVSIGNEERFVEEPDDHNTYWARAYSNTLTDLQFLGNSDNTHFRGISKLLTAFVYHGLVDHFGSVPFSQALLGEEGVFAPTFDEGSAIYPQLVTMVDDALADFSLTASPIGSEDLVYGGRYGQLGQICEFI